MRCQLPALACLMLAAGCGPSTPPPVVPDDEGQATPPRTTGPSVTPAEGATAIEQPCTEGVDERCDAVDQNCDGRIDEGCGYEQGALQVTLAWNSDADLDLAITTPDGATLDAENRQSPSGGILDRQARGACGEETARDRLENAYWPTDPPSGEYSVAVEYADACTEGDPPATTATVSISRAGQILGVYNISLTAPGTTPVATLTL